MVAAELNNQFKSGMLQKSRLQGLSLASMSVIRPIKKAIYIYLNFTSRSLLFLNLLHHSENYPGTATTLPLDWKNQRKKVATLVT